MIAVSLNSIPIVWWMTPMQNKVISPLLDDVKLGSVIFSTGFIFYFLISYRY
ncbi:hypothetical protein VCHA41O245_90052 [Vibrio chagasii]|nr:hypothetical protein VCHA41O245_90052 [Vibrio chagasii]